jgi:hypothetical protein
MLLGMQAAKLKQARTQAAHKHARASLLAMQQEEPPPHLRDALERKRAKEAAKAAEQGYPAPAPAAPAARPSATGDPTGLPIPMDGSFGKDPHQTAEQEARTAKYVRWINSNKHGYDCKDGVNYVNTGVPPKMGPPRDMEAQYLTWINSNKHGYDCTDGMKVVWKAGGGIPKAYDTEERWYKKHKKGGFWTR